jgi:hypothetical protein
VTGNALPSGAPSDEFRAALDTNDAELKKVAKKRGGKVQKIELEKLGSWTVPNRPFDRARVLETKAASVVVNVVRSEKRGRGESATVEWRARHLVGVPAKDAEVTSITHTLTTSVPMIGELRVPHFFYAADADARAEHAWTLPKGASAPSIDGFTFAGCYSGMLYAKSDAVSIDAAAIEAAIEALERAASLGWIAPTPEEREARKRASMQRGRARAILTCGVIFLLFGAVVSGLVYLAITSS